jgi:hypothetical protein
MAAGLAAAGLAGAGFAGGKAVWADVTDESINDAATTKRLLENGINVTGSRTGRARFNRAGRISQRVAPACRCDNAAFAGAKAAVQARLVHGSLPPEPVSGGCSERPCPCRLAYLQPET